MEYLEKVEWNVERDSRICGGVEHDDGWIVTGECPFLDEDGKVSGLVPITIYFDEDLGVLDVSGAVHEDHELDVIQAARKELPSSPGE